VLFRKLLAKSGGIDDFVRLPVPFRAVAADIETGTLVGRVSFAFLLNRRSKASSLSFLIKRMVRRLGNGAAEHLSETIAEVVYICWIEGGY
jgi:hypothetical protein